MRNRRLLLGSLGLLLSIPAFSQNKSIAVNNYTGALNVAVPLYTVTSNSVSIPVTAVYQTNGIKVKDVKNDLGMNWHLVAGGEISRQVRGLPDDIKKDNSANARLGWLYNTNGTKINSFTIANDNNPAVCTDETADNTYITTNFSDLSDTEPDIFNVSAPGLACQFVFDNGHVIRTIPYQDLKIAYNTNPTTGAIVKFTVTNDKGVTYTFGSTVVPVPPAVSTFYEKETRTAVSAGTISYFKRTYDQYQNGITFNRTWKPESVISVAGGEIHVLYAPGVQRIYNDPVSVILPGASASTNQYSINVTTTPLLVHKFILDTDGAPDLLVFTNAGNIYQSVNGMGRTTRFIYQGLSSAGTDRSFLKSITQQGGATYSDFGFGYSGVTYATAGTPISVNLPDSTSKEIDYWGYYNASGATSLSPQVYINPANAALERYRSQAPGSSASSYPYSISGTARDAALSGAVNGSLNKIWSNTGDTTTVEYELNSFFDNTAATVVQGGGIRVKKITAFDGFDAANNIVTNYSYVIPGGSVSSGRAITMPSYAFTTPYTGSGTTAAKWASSTVRSELDLANEDESIVYNYIKVSRTGTGNIQYEYTVPATYWDSSASPDWLPSTVYSGRISCTTATFANNQTNNYPYPQNPNFDFERGLLKKMSTFNDAGQQTGEESYSYQRSYTTPTIITGFKFDNNTSSARNYAKYSIFAATSELLVQQTKKVFDLPALTSFTTDTTKYFYASAAHKLPTSTEAKNSDGSIIRNYIKYVKDYTSALGADSMANSIYRLQQDNANIPIEQYQQVQRQGTTVTTSAELTLYKFYGEFTNREKPSQSLQLASMNGLTDFQPSSIASNIFTRDSRYIVKTNYLTYDDLGRVQSADNNRHQVMTTFTDYTHDLTFAAFKNALAKEIAFNDFDNYYSRTGFNYTDTTRVLGDRNGLYAVNIKPTSLITDTIYKNVLVNNYLFSLWVKTSVASTIALQMTDGTHTNNATLTVPNTSSKWQYLQKSIPVNNLNATFTAKFTPSVNTLIDDVVLYPEIAQAAYTAYNSSYQKLSETNTNGISTYYGYDDFGRPRLIYDQDKNIVKRTVYLNAATAKQVDTLAVTGGGNYGPPIQLTAYVDPILSRDGMTFTWNFGDGKPIVTTGDISVMHAFSSGGTYHVTLTRNSPAYPSKTVTNDIFISIPGGQRFRIIASSLPGATVTSLQIYKDGVVVGTFNGASLLTGNEYFASGVYDIVVGVDGSLYKPSLGTGYKSISLYIDGQTYSPCQQRDNKQSTIAGYSFPSVNLSGTAELGISLGINDCAPPEE